ncbi:MAG: hypothetical protein PVI90_12490 [Desulfobacteraceae bacterium]|jgi:DNA-binding transcriptional MerR regulator
MTTDGIQNRFSRAEIAEALEISGNQILQYQERGLLADRTAHAQDIAYNSLDIARLRFILRCEAAGYHGKDVVDFIGTINKGANIKDQLKASLVHAHQKFSYVNAQKRKADILEQVSLQADADLIQKYIDEMKGILANPQSSPLPATPPKPKPKVEPQTTISSKSQSTQNWSADVAEEVRQPSRLKMGMERAQGFVEDDATQLTPPRRGPAIPKRTVPKKARNKFIDSSDASDEYNQRMSDSTQDDLYIDYTRPTKSRSAPWKQTLITFLLLSLLSAAGYTYYVLQSKKPSMTDSTASIQESQLADSFAEEQEEVSTETVVSTDFESEESTSATISQPQTIETAEDSESSEEIEQEAIQPQETEEEQSTQADTTASLATPTTNDDDSSKSDSPPSTTTPSSPYQNTESSISGTATKDLDDLLAEKQNNSQIVTEDYEIAERPQVAVYDFKIFYQLSRKILIAKFKIARISPQRNLIQGRLFVVFKPRQSAQDLNYFSVPDARIADGIPTEPFKGIEFSFAESTKIQSVRTIYVRDPSQFDVATVFVFSNAGELVLRKDFTVNVTEY